jgi:hypothetical protein
VSLDKHRLGCSWIDRPQTLGEFVDAAAAYLKCLRPLHPLFSGPLFLTGSAPKEFEPLAADLSNLEGFVRRFGWNRKAPADRHIGVLPDRTMGTEGTSRLGFHINLNSSGRTTKPETVCLSFSGGTPGAVLPSAISVRFPMAGAPEFEQYGFVKDLMKVSVDAWRPCLGYVISSEFSRPQDLDTTQYPAIGWMNYFANAGVQEAVPANVECESFGPGGVLLTLQRERPSPDDVQAVARAKRIRETLLPGHWFDYEVVCAASPAIPAAT